MKDEVTKKDVIEFVHFIIKALWMTNTTMFWNIFIPQLINQEKYSSNVNTYKLCNLMNNIDIDSLINCICLLKNISSIYLISVIFLKLDPAF